MGLTNNLGKLSNMITSTGSAVGIGTSSPNGLFNVYGTSPTINLTDGSVSSNGGNVYLSAQKTGVGYNNLTMTAYSYTFLGGGSASTFLTISTAGNVGIGTTTPSYTLDVTGTGRFTSALSAVTNLYVGSASGSGNLEQMYLLSTANQSLRINNTNNASGNINIVSLLGSNANNNTSYHFYGYTGASLASAIYGNGGAYFANSVGIGNTIPLSLLEVKGGTPFIRITDTTTNSETGLIMDANGGIRGGLTINYGTGEFKHYCGISGNSYFQTFHTNGSERMRITSTGLVGIGTSSPSASLEVVNGVTVTQNAFPQLLLRNVTDTNRQLLIGYDYANNAGYIQSIQQGVAYRILYLNANGGAVYAGGVRLDTLSDVRMKDNIQPIENALDKVLSITGKKFHLKDEEEGKLRYGFIAQELEGVLDEFVIQTKMTYKDESTNEEVKDLKSIENWASSWAALLVEAIKEQQSTINQLETRIKTLENK